MKRRDFNDLSARALAIAVIGGLIVSTLLSLLFVPAFFTLMDDFGRLMARIFGRFIGGADEHPPGAAPKPSASDAHPPDKAAADHVGKAPSRHPTP